MLVPRNFYKIWFLTTEKIKFLLGNDRFIVSSMYTSAKSTVDTLPWRGGSIFLRNLHSHCWPYTASYTRRPQSQLRELFYTCIYPWNLIPLVSELVAKSRCRGQDNIKTELKREKLFLDWVNLAQERIYWRDYLNKQSDPIKFGKNLDHLNNL